MADAIETFLSYLENGGNDDGPESGDNVVIIDDKEDGHPSSNPDPEVDSVASRNEFITAAKLLVKQEKADEDTTPVGPDIVDLFGEFDDEDDNWLNDVDVNCDGEKDGHSKTTSRTSIQEEEPPAKGFSIGSSAGIAKKPVAVTKSGSNRHDASSGTKLSNCDKSLVSFGGIRIKDLVFEPHEIERRMKSTTMVPLSQIPWKIKAKNNEVDFDWITFGVVISKEMKSSAKNGSAYTLMKLSDLKDVSKHVSLFLFGESHGVHWKLMTSSVVGLLNPKIMSNNQSNNGFGDKSSIKKDEICSLTLNNPGHLVHIGSSADLGYCKSVKKNGDVCGAVINKSDCTTCIFHVQSEYKKMSSKRPELKLSYSGITPKSRHDMPSFLSSGSNNYGTDGDGDNSSLNSNHVALIGPMSSASFNQSIKRALSDPKDDGTKNSSSFAAALSSSDPKDNHKIFGAKKVRIGDVLPPEDAAKDVPKDVSKDGGKKKKIRMTKEEWEAEKRRRQELIDSYQLRKRMEVEMIERELSRPLSLAAKNLAIATGAIDGEKDNVKDIKKKIDAAKDGQRISLSGATNPMDVFKHLKNGSNDVKPSVPLLGRGLKPGQDVTINLVKKPKASQHVPRRVSNFSAEDARKLKHNLLMAQRKREAAKILASASSPPSAASSSKDKTDGKMNEDKEKDAKKKRLEELKRKVSTNFSDESQESNEEKLKKINEALKRKSKHEFEVKLIESIDEANYFSRLERREMIEEKMASIKDMKVKGIICPTCKYISESQSEYCMKNNHQIMRREVIKKFLACNSCNYKIVGYNSFVPNNRVCPKCKGKEFKSSCLRPSKLITSTDVDPLKIRGDEIKFLNSFN